MTGITKMTNMTAKNKYKKLMKIGGKIGAKTSKNTDKKTAGNMIENTVKNAVKNTTKTRSRDVPEVILGEGGDALNGLQHKGFPSFWGFGNEKDKKARISIGYGRAVVPKISRSRERSRKKYQKINNLTVPVPKLVPEIKCMKINSLQQKTRSQALIYNIWIIISYPYYIIIGARWGVNQQ